MRPLPDGLKVFARVLRHEVRERSIELLDPNLAEDVDVRRTHELLAEDLEAVALLSC